MQAHSYMVNDCTFNYIFMCRVLPLQIFVNQLEVQNISYSQLMYNVTNLTCGVTYTIGVSAGNTAGYSRVNQIQIQTSRGEGMQGTLCMCK